MLVMTILAGCNKVVDAGTDSIEVGREVRIEGLRGNATALTASLGGGFVVVGYSWAVATDAKGEVLWRYSEPADTANRAEYHGAVALSDGNTLLCGLEWTEHGSIGLLSILNSSGQLVEKRPMRPPSPGAYIASTLERCKRWGDGIVLMGTATTDHDGLGWLVTLDDGGAKKWEIVDPMLVALDAVETANHNLALAAMTGTTRSATLVQVNPQWKIESARALTGFPDRMVRSVAANPTLKVQTNIDRADPSVITLNEKYEEIAAPISTGIMMTGKGCAWTLSDGSLALFGNVFANGGVYQASPPPASGSATNRLRYELCRY